MNADIHAHKILKYSQKRVNDPGNPVYVAKYKHYRGVMDGGSYKYDDNWVIPQVDDDNFDYRKFYRQAREAQKKIIERSIESIARIEKNALKYIAGPNVMYVLTRNDRTVMLFGETHYVSEDYECGIGDDANTLHIAEFMYYMLRANKDKVFDIFMEDILYPNRQLSFTTQKYVIGPGSSGPMANVRYLFASCRFDLKKRSECRNEFPNLRYHATDQRTPYHTSAESDIVNQIIDAYLFIHFEYDIIVNAFKDNDKPVDGALISRIETNVAIIEKNIISNVEGWVDIIFNIPEIRKQYEKSTDPNLRSIVRKWFREILNKRFEDGIKKYQGQNKSLLERYMIACVAEDYVVIMLDIHTIGRMFKKFTFREKYTGEIFVDTADNIIVYSGAWHTKMIMGFLMHYGFNMSMSFVGSNDECIEIGHNFMNDIIPLLH